MAEQLIHEWLEATQGSDQVLIHEERALSELASSLDSGIVAFPEFIKSFTSRLEQELDLTVAGRILFALPKTFATLQNEPTRHEVHVLIPYLCARLEDASPGIYYVAEALQIMVKWTRFAPGDAQEVARAIFKLGASNNFSSQTAVTRLSLYSLVDVLRTTRAAAIKRDMSVKEFAKGIVTMAELEKNPSCLRALFSLYANLSRDWELDESDFKQIFDSYVRYFPITMKDAPKDPKIPTTAELRDLLLACFVASDGFAQPTFAAMIERLDVDSANTKVEVFKTMSTAVQSYSVSTVAQSATKLWDSLKFEVWNGENEQWIQSSLDLLREIATSLDRLPSDWSDKANAVHMFVINALTECRDRIKDKPTTYLRTSGRIFNALASASPYAFYLTSRSVIPIMDTLAQAHSGGAERTFVLEVLNGILGARLAQDDIRAASAHEDPGKTSEVSEYYSTSLNTMTTSFSSFRDRIIEIYRDGIAEIVKTSETSQDTAHCVPAVKGLELMFNIPSFLSDSGKAVIVQELVQVVLTPDPKDEILEQSLVALSTISGLQPELFQSVILPRILGALPDQLSGDTSEKDAQLASVISLLENAVRISSSSNSNAQCRSLNFAALEENLIRRLVKILPVSDQQQYHHAILASISAWFDYSTDDSSAATSVSQSLLSKPEQFTPIPFLLSHIVELKSTNGQEYIQTANTVDDTMARFVGEYIMRSLRSKMVSSSSIMEWDKNHPNSSSVVWNIFTSRNVSTIDTIQANSAANQESQRLAIALSMYLIAGAQREDIQYLKSRFDHQELAKALIVDAITSNPEVSRFSRLSNLHLLQLLVNKFGAARDTDLTDFVSSKVESVKKLDQTEGSSVFQVLAYLTAASLAALDPCSTVLVQHLLGGLQDNKHGRKIAQSFRLLLAPSELITKENACVVRPLRKGRLYQLAVIPLSTSWRTSQDPNIKENALIALTGVLAFLEPSMLADNAKELMPILLEGTNIRGDQFAKNACIKVILDLLPLAPKIIEEHIAAVIERMTGRTHNTPNSPSDSNIRGRAMALEVLSKLTEIIDKNVLLKRKPGLMKELNYALEDSSSEVRSKAERCKMSWFNLTDGE